MCYTVKIEHTREALQQRFGADFGSDNEYRTGNRISAFSLPELPVICSSDQSVIKVFTWGLIPFWVKTAKDAEAIRMKTFNARSESLAERSSFRHLVNRKHCIVPVTGFYEWQHEGRNKIPYFISLREQDILCLAGLYDSWTDKSTGNTFNTFTILTTNANPMMEVIHNTQKRMPVILSPAGEKEWLNAEHADVPALSIPFPEESMSAEKITM